MRGEAKVVDPQISGALIHHLTNHVHFHLQKQNNRTSDFQRILIRTALLTTAICRNYTPSAGFPVTHKYASVTSVILTTVLYLFTVFVNFTLQNQIRLMHM